jgi:uncharacterized membrane-anchored protein
MDWSEKARIREVRKQELDRLENAILQIEKLEKEWLRNLPHYSPSVMEQQRTPFTAKKNELTERIKSLTEASDKEAQKEKRSAIVMAVGFFIVGAVLIVAGPIAFVQRPSSVTSGWLLLFGFIPIPIFFLASPKFWGVVLTLAGLGLIGGGIQIIHEK